mmetsp:Transcript_5704/g.6629  ORF Transcript_5704/g.6629 Transcript_5704/m.6629 type:complete len:304 (+) Transcript_5704:43-954(+)
MALHLLHFSLLLTTASGFVTPNVGHVTKSCDSSHHQNAFVSVSHNQCKNGVSLEMVAIESNIVASVFAATVGYIMYQDAVEISDKKKEKRARISGETQEVVKTIKAVKDEPELKKVIDEVKVESNEPEPENFFEEVSVESDEPEESREPSTASNDIEESELVGEVNLEPKEPASLVEPPSTRSDTSQEVDEAESFTDVVAAEMEKIKQVAVESFNLGSDILDIKRSVASTLQGEKEKVDRLEAVPEKNVSTEEIIQSSQETPQEEVPVTDEIVVETPVYGRKRRFMKKTVKKMLMPWKKWSNL